MTALQTCIFLSQRCVEACEREISKPGTARAELRDLMTRRDAIAADLASADRNVFIRWANGRMTDAEIDAVLRTDEAS